MRILITGSNGFVGGYLREFFVSKGEEVYGFDRTGSTREGVIVGDITDAAAVSKALSDIQPERIVHLAGFSSVNDSLKDPENARAVNVEGTRNLLEAARTLTNKPRILLVSSSEVYGKPDENPVTEDMALQPITPYGVSRVEQEALVQEYSDIEVIISRSFNHTGPGQPDVAVVPSLAKQIASIEAGLNNPVVQVGNLDNVRDFTDVRDVVEAYGVLLEKGVPGEAYNVGSGEGITIGRILELMLALTTEDIEKVTDPRRIRAVDVPAIYADTTKFRKLTGAGEYGLVRDHRIPLLQTLEDTLNYWREKVNA